MNQVENAIYQLIKTMAGGKVYFALAPTNENGPFIVINLTGHERWSSLSGPSGLSDSSIQIDVYAQSRAPMKALSSQVIDILDGYRGTVMTPSGTIRIGATKLEDAYDLIDQEDEPVMFRSLLRFSVIYNDGG